MDPDDTVYLGGAWDAAQSLTLGQAYSAISLDGVLQISSEQWDKLCE